MSELTDSLAFTYVPPEDESVDGEYEVFLDGEKTAYSIQDASGFYCVNEHGYDVPGDDATFYVVDHGEFRSLERAKQRAAELVAAALETAPPAPAV